MKGMRTFGLLRLLLLTVAITVLMPAFCQITSVPLKSGTTDPKSDGFIYALPLNVVKVDVYVSKTSNYKGKYNDFAAKLLGITDVISKDAITYNIDKVEVTTLCDVDTNQYYYAVLPHKLKNDYTFMVNLTEKGFISGYYSIDKEEIERNQKGTSLTPFRDLLKPILIEKVDTIIRRVSIDTTIIEEKVLKRSISEKSNEQQAREIADLIYRIEDNKFSLITGYQEVNYSKESMQFMFQGLNKMEQEYLAFFKGLSITTEERYTYYYTPGEAVKGSMSTLFRFSPFMGIIDKNIPSGDAVSIFVTPQNHHKMVREFEIQRMQTKRHSHGLFYRIPQEVKIDIKVGDKLFTSHNALISQMGIITFLPSNVSNVDFFENGTLKSLILE